MASKTPLGRKADELGANGYGDLVIHQAHAHGLSASLGLAVVEHESSFANVFGSDPVRSPQIQGGPVTRTRYLRYRFLRRRGFGMQGVGLTQLTWYSYQDDADAIGGCYKPEPQLRVGFRLLAALIAAHGEHDGLRRYNGAGGAAEQYANDVLAIRDRWHNEL
jgi:hypothetical protein